MKLDLEDSIPEQVIRLVVATYILGQIVDTPTHGLQGQASKEAKVKAAFDYADLLLKG